jgi:hypothetical protein
MTDPAGLYFRPGPGGMTVLAPLAPGMVSHVPIEEWRKLLLGERVRVGFSPGTIALDGEREFSILPGQRVEVAISDNGPRVVILENALREASSRGVFATQSA